jgi:apolipoprotein N-acyltransferase
MNTAAPLASAAPDTAAVQSESGRAADRAPVERVSSPHRDLGALLIWVAVAAISFHLAYAWSAAACPLIALYLVALVRLAQADTWRKAFYSGLAVGLLIATVRLAFFWRIFSGGAPALWLVLAFWIGIFVTLARLSLRRLPAPWGWCCLPFLWCGLEYFRSELYYLRFAWLSPGFAFGPVPGFVPLRYVGTYGTGFALMCLAAAAVGLWAKSRISSMAALVVGLGGLHLWGLAANAKPVSPVVGTLRVAGVQMEFPSEPEVIHRLNELIPKHPETDLVVLSEYTFNEPIPAKVKEWCREHHRYLVIGGTEPVLPKNFFDTAFVVGPNGDIVFRQAKSVPIQFFKDGLAATEQKLWDSPWGKIGMCVCYDLSYSRVTDRLLRLGAQALIVPTMDVIDWGQAQHELHARVAPLRAAEYGIPIFRLASSGISQAVDASGQVLASAPCPGIGAQIAAVLELRGSGTLPWDRWLAPFAVVVTGVLSLWFLLKRPIKLC